MDNVLIVSRTTNGKDIFLGGVNLDTDRHVQLGPSYVGYAHAKDVQLSVGEVWRLQLGQFPELPVCPPHVENRNIIFKEATDIKLQPGEMRDLILNRIRAPFVQPNTLFDGQVDFNLNGKAFVDVNDSELSYSIGFWRFHESLYLDYDNNELEDGRYYQTESRDFRVKYTGVANPINTLQPGTILRFFLSQSYEVPGRHVYWVLLSGWLS